MSRTRVLFAWVGLLVLGVLAGCGVEQQAVVAQADLVEVSPGERISKDVLRNDLVGAASTVDLVATPVDFPGQVALRPDGLITVSAAPTATAGDHVVAYVVESVGHEAPGTVVIRILDSGGDDGDEEEVDDGKDDDDAEVDDGEDDDDAEDDDGEDDDQDNGGEDLVTVGSYVGLLSGVAADRVNGDGLKVRVVERVVTDLADDDVVVAQDPEADRSVDPGATVTLTVGRYQPTTVKVGDWVGDEITSAERDIEDLGLTLLVETVPVQSPGDDGIVLDQSPAPGAEVDVGASVRLIVGILVVVPDVVGLPEPEGRAAMAEAQRAVGQTPQNFEDRVCEPAAAGRIVEQSPKAGTEVDSAFDVVLVIAAECRDIPDLIGFNLADAAPILEDWRSDGRQFSWTTPCPSPTSAEAEKWEIDSISPGVGVFTAQFSIRCVPAGVSPP